MADATQNGTSDLMKRLKAQTELLQQQKAGEGPPQQLGLPTQSGGAAAPAQPVPVPAAYADPIGRAAAQLANGEIKWDAGAGQIYAREGADTGWICRPPTVPEKIAIEETAKLKEMVSSETRTIPAPPMGSHARETGPAVVPPDAPPRTNQPGDAEAVAKPRRARKEQKATISVEQPDGSMSAPRPVDEVAVEAPGVDPFLKSLAERTGAAQVVVDRATGVPTQLVPPRAAQPQAKPGPVIYVNCIPTKGEHRGLGIHFEEWMAPIMDQLCREKGVLDYRLIPYSAKGDLAAKVRACVEALPAVVLVSKFSPGADVFLEAVIPHASQIVQGV